MPSQVRIISRPNSREWDDIIDRAVKNNAWREENTYWTTDGEARADDIRKKLRTAGRHLGVAVKAYYAPCPDRGHCRHNAECTHHVYYTIFPLEEAREYKRKQASSKPQYRR